MHTRVFVRTVLLPLAAASLLAANVTFASVTRDEAATVHYRTVRVDGVEVFYREAGPADAPTLVLLHGFPSSSHMFRKLIPALSERYHVIAPDYPGFGLSEAPDRARFQYSFAKLTDVVDALLTRLDVKRYAIYVMDYGAPVGYRLALRHPERVTALVVQNGNAYAEGLREFWTPIKAYWASGSPAHREALRAGTTLEATRAQYLDGVSDPARIDPTAWLFDQARLDRPGNVDIQLDLFYDYRTNVELYPQFQGFFRQRKPPTLIVWGRNDRIFPADGAHPYKRDLPDAELHLLDTGHFALEDKGAEIARLMLDFLERKLPHRAGQPPAALGSRR
ncbi:MAG TPA: alpha/beta hydrolase [Steroidobacteraceae bacterium]|nr:alpha/beta hydrolase [Steroidobacteraceae bacterium]